MATGRATLRFERYVGIDYSGAETASSRLPNLQVHAAIAATNLASFRRLIHPRAVLGIGRGKKTTEWLIERIRSGTRLIAGVDRAFSLSHRYFQPYELTRWSQFLDHFVEHRPTHHLHVIVDLVRDRGPTRTVSSDEFRMTETWTSSAKSVFRFDIQGRVAKWTHAGIPWLRHIREQVGERMHFWLFEGREPPRAATLTL